MIQNQLITSACERFVEDPLKCSCSATVCSANSSVTTHTSSTASASVPITVVTASDHCHTEGVNDLLDQVVAHAANPMLTVELKHSHSKRSQSFSNLHQLQDCEEAQLNLLKLKYPSAYSLNVKGIVEESADHVEKTLRNLISAASKVNASYSKRSVVSDDGITATHSLTNFTKAATMAHVDIPHVTSMASLNAVSSSTLMNSDSSNSRSTQDIASIQDMSSTRMLHRAFSNLEHQLYQERKEALKHWSVEKDTVHIKKDLSKDYIKAFRNSLGLPATHTIPTRSKEETNYLFEEILQELEDNQHNKRYSEGNVVALSTTMSGHCRLSLDPSINLTSSASHDVSVSHDHGMTTPHFTKPSDSIASCDLITSHETGLVTTHECTPLLSTDHLDYYRDSFMGTVTIPYDMAEDEPGSTALKQLVTISSNEECLGHIVACVCLPAFSSKLLRLSQWQCSSAGLLSNMAALLYNLFKVIDSMYVS